MTKPKQQTVPAAAVTLIPAPPVKLMEKVTPKTPPMQRVTATQKPIKKKTVKAHAKK